MKQFFMAFVASVGVSVASAADSEFDLGPVTDENLVELEAEYEYDLLTLLAEEQLAEGAATEIQRRGGYTQRGRPGYRPRPPHQRPPVYRPAPPRSRYATCYVRNARGRLFSATARTPRQAQSAAINRCHRVSHFCFSQGCRY